MHDDWELDPAQPKPKKKRHWFRRIAVILIVLLLPGLDQSLVVRRYPMDVETISDRVRLALITDLHSNPYGKEQQTLLDAVEQQEPDVVLLGGDIFDERMDTKAAETTLRVLGEIYPCYYVIGNHECWGTMEQFEEDMRILHDCGIEILSGETVTLTVNGQTFDLCGVDDPIAYPFPPEEGQEKRLDFAAQLKQVKAASDNGHYTVLLSHRPERFEEYVEQGFDLVLSGHAHGGQWRIPFLLNGLYAPDQGLFPKYAGGMYQSGSTTMIVSRGLARITPLVPRIYDRPELVIVDLE